MLWKFSFPILILSGILLCRPTLAQDLIFWGVYPEYYQATDPYTTPPDDEINDSPVSDSDKDKPSVPEEKFAQKIDADSVLAVEGAFLIGPFPSEPQKECHLNFLIPKRITLRHVEGSGDGIGFNTDYSTLALLFASEYKVGHFMPMIDLRGHRFDNGHFAANIGVATRYIPQPNAFCELLGFNLFYDWREGLHQSFNQVGVGIEILGKRWDFRANGYIPIGDVVFEKKCVFDDYVGHYRATRHVCEFTNYGYNLEVGYLIVNSKNFLLYAAAGPYYLARKSHHHHTRGWEARIRPQFRDYLAVDLSISHDPVFETVYQAAVILYLPLYQICRKNKGPCGITDRQIYQPIERFELMPLGRRDCWKYNW